VGSIQRVSGIVAEITSATVEQSSGVRQVGEAVSQMDQATQQNAALVEESAAAAESLRGQAQQLVQAVAVFKLSHESHAGAAYAAQPAANAPSGERRGPHRATNVTRPAFEARPAAASAPAGEPSAMPGAAPGTGDERMLRYESLVHEGADALLEAQASELKRRGMHLNEKTSEFGAAMRMFEGAYALLLQASTLVSVANMAFKLGQVMTSLT
jgi:hypothetical protein